MKIVFSTRAASIILASACRSPMFRLDVSTRIGVGAKRAAMRLSFRRSGFVVCALSSGKRNRPSASRAAPFIETPFDASHQGRARQHTKPRMHLGLRDLSRAESLSYGLVIFF